MSRRQKLVVILLAIADLIVLGGLATVVTLFSPRSGGEAPATAIVEASPSATATATLPPTWTPAPTSSPEPTTTRGPTSTPGPTRTPMDFPTRTPTPPVTPTPDEPLREAGVLENADFEAILPDRVPGWEVAAVANWEPGQDFNADSSFGRPEFGPADDQRRVISGTTLMISTYQWVKFSATLYQIVDVDPGSLIQFSIQARGYSDNGGIQVRVGVDAAGGAACGEGLWSETRVIDQYGGLAVLDSPEATVGEGGQVTVCFFAEPQYASMHSAAFFDVAQLVVQPPEEE